MVAETIDDLKVSRIGHGINAVHDDQLIDRIIDQGIVLEVCPGSNVVLQAVTGWDAHPIDILRKKGVKITVSTDDPPFFNTTMNDEFAMLAKTFGWDKPVFDALNQTAIQAAFCDEVTRSAILKRLETS